jgi:hypothetical protein
VYIYERQIDALYAMKHGSIYCTQHIFDTHNNFRNNIIHMFVSNINTYLILRRVSDMETRLVRKYFIRNRLYMT